MMGIWLFVLISNVEGCSMASVAPEGVLSPRDIGMFERQDLHRTGSRFHGSDRMEASGSIMFCLSAVDSAYSPRLNF